MNWTELPGPKAFLSMVEQDLRDSKSVLAVVPSCFDEQWIGTIRQGTDQLFEWQEISETVSEFLRDVSGRSDGLPLADARELIEQGVGGRGFVLRNPTSEEWTAWAGFLREFSELNRNLEDFDKGVFLVATEGNEIQMPNEPNLSSRRIDHYLRREDSLIHAFQIVDEDPKGELWRSIRVHVASELAVWDFQLCETLCDLPALQLMDPHACLMDYADRRGWGRLGPESSEKELRHEGLLFSLAGKEFHHSAWLAARGKRQELEKRIWTAQVRVLFPIIEEQRMSLLTELRKIHSGTIDSWQRDLGEDDELEIGLIHHRMLVSKAFTPRLNSLAGRLRNIRNKLAHLSICEPSDIPADNEWLK
jgi:hypothetical protein